MDIHDRRFVDLAGAFNFRDLGGLPTADGAQTRDGVLFRSDALHHLTAEDIDRIATLGIRTIIDLRSSTEVDRTGRGLLGEEDIAWVHAPLTHSDPDGNYVLPPALAAGDLGAHYVGSLGERTPMLVSIVEQLSSTEHLPVVFHCTAGKDRTGIVAALVLELVGVAREVIVEDYVLTDARMALVMDRLRTSGDVTESADPVAAGVARAEAHSMNTFLDAVEEEYGGAKGWAHAAGVHDETLAALRAVLVGPST